MHTDTSTIPSARPPEHEAGRGHALVDAVASIGPNAVIQTLRALEQVSTRRTVAGIRARAGIGPHMPVRMIPEADFIALVREVRRTLPGAAAEDVLVRAGRYTAMYVGQNRIPGLFRWLLRVLPPKWSIPLLLRAFEKHAWTFAGSGRFHVEGPPPGTLVLEAAPTCGSAAGPSSSGGYYVAAFQGLLELAAPGIHVREVACRAAGRPACRFRLELRDSSAGDPPQCASSSSTRTTTPGEPRSPGTGRPPGSPI